ncbi:uncharacterized protein [Prorops nasuta]|uniref:uncharacterized protein n=1 Tax=Prorops nasuta TaxID=863751 RepID=UPI0034D00D74
MQRRVGVKSAIKRSNSLKKEKKSNSLHVVLPVSVSINSKKRHVRSACSRISSKRIISSSKSLKKSSSETESIDQDSEKTKKTTEAAEKPAELPKDLAAHFGCFYGLEEIQPKPN